MFNLGFEAFATFIIIVAPIAIVLFLFLVVMAYPWLLLVPLGIWYLSIKFGPEEAPSAQEGSDPAGYSGHVQADTGVNAETT